MREFEWFEFKDVSLRPKAKVKVKSPKIGLFDRKTLVKFKSNDKPTGTHRKMGDTATYSKAYDVAFRFYLLSPVDCLYLLGTYSRLIVCCTID